MITFSTYANKKFEILNQHKVYLRQEQIEQVVLQPNRVAKISLYHHAYGDDANVVYKKNGDDIIILTFYPA
ncbi:MAG: hypothetical protein WCK11_03985 [Candidatus Falkowbacteria bacterium]